MNDSAGKYFLIVLFALIVGVSINQAVSRDDYHNGTYIATKSFFGMRNAWVIKGDRIMVHSNITSVNLPCKQYEDRIEYDQDYLLVAYINERGNIELSNVQTNLMDLNVEMIMISDRTDFTHQEMMTLLDSAYNN